MGTLQVEYWFMSKCMVGMSSMGTHTSDVNVHTMHSTGTSKHVLVR